MELKNSRWHSSILIKMVFLVFTLGIGNGAMAASEWMCTAGTLAYTACCCSGGENENQKWVIVDPSNTSDDPCSGACFQPYHANTDPTCTQSSLVMNDSRSLIDYMKDVYNASC